MAEENKKVEWLLYVLLTKKTNKGKEVEIGKKAKGEHCLREGWIEDALREIHMGDEMSL